MNEASSEVTSEDIEEALVVHIFEPGEIIEVELADNGEGALISNDDMPWAQWPTPYTVNGELNDLVAYEEGGSLALQLVQDGVITPVGLLSGEVMGSIAKYAGFPANFVQKLPCDLRAAVVSDRLKTADYHGFKFVTENNRLTNLMPDWRDILPYGDAAQIAYDTLTKEMGFVEINESILSDGKMLLRLFTQQEDAITPKVGDILQYGLEIRHDYSNSMSVNVYTRRLVCENGMSVNQPSFQWTHQSQAGRDYQANWLEAGVRGAASVYNELVSRAQLMSTTLYEGDAHEVLNRRAEALGISGRYRPAIMASFDEEPGNTEWHLVNALTRFATHSADLSENQRSAFLGVAGDFTKEFKLVNASLPQNIAKKVGARILSEV